MGEQEKEERQRKLEAEGISPGKMDINPFERRATRVTNLWDMTSRRVLLPLDLDDDHHEPTKLASKLSKPSKPSPVVHPVGPSAAAASKKRPADSDEVSWRYVEETTDSELALPESSPGATSSKEAPPELSTVLPAGGESSVLHEPAASTTEDPNKMSKMICEMIMRRKRLRTAEGDDPFRPDHNNS